jgi:hypothetical protein
MKSNEPTFGTLLNRVRRGTDDDWAEFTLHLPRFLDAEYVTWAMSGRKDLNENIRDAAATLLAYSDVPLTDEQQNMLRAQMGDDTNVFVRHWLANALYKRGNRSPDVVATWTDA